MIRIALGWTILHSLWEGAIVALLLAAALSVLRSSRARYAAACLAMLVLLATFGLTLSRAIQTGSVAVPAVSHGLSAAALDGLDRAHIVPSRFGAADVLPWLAPFWVAGVVLFHLYSLLGWVAARRMLRRGVCSAPDSWQRRLTRLRERLKLSTPVVLLESCLADVPVVIGYLRPVVLVPVGMLTAMPAGQIEAVLLHELAHIRRRDYLVNLLQTVVEGFLFYHPAVWWISGVIRAERENCCDDLVVATSGDAHEYAAALAVLEQTRWAASDAVLAATGGNLMQRIRRLLDPLDAPRTALSPVLSVVILTLTAALALTAWQARPQDTPAEAREKNPYQLWLTEDVVYIITDREVSAFKALETHPERRMFITQFWERRNPIPGAAENQFKEEHYRRIAYVNDHFPASIPGWKTDRGRIYIVYGPPDEIESHPAGGQGKSFPYEQWLYHHIEGVGENVIIDFEDPAGTGDYHMTKDPNEKPK
jgi:GWxTD domain-containing protein